MNFPYNLELELFWNMTSTTLAISPAYGFIGLDRGKTVVSHGYNYISMIRVDGNANPFETIVGSVSESTDNVEI